MRAPVLREVCPGVYVNPDNVAAVYFNPLDAGTCMEPDSIYYMDVSVVVRLRDGKEITTVFCADGEATDARLREMIDGVLEALK